MTFAFNRPPRELEGRHAFLSASKYHWINYTPEKLAETYGKSMDAALGTRLHALANELIQLGIKLPDNSKTLNRYVNDCISLRMQTEQMLVYSENAFGTADAIDFARKLLRIFDLKNGITPASVHQLEVYAAFFCLEYKIDPREIDIDLRIYQNDECMEFDTDPEDILYIMDRIKEYDALIERLKREV